MLVRITTITHPGTNFSTALLCFKWASSGIEGWDVYIFWALLATHLTAGFVYAKKGIYPPTLAYW